jgi:hypothetical protein
MTKFFKDKTDDFGFLSIKEECTKFYLSSKGSHQFKGDVNSPIDLKCSTITGNTAKEKVTTGTGMTSSVRGTEVRGIRVYIEYHVRSAIS